MNLRIDHYVHIVPSATADAKLDEILSRLTTALEGVTAMSAQLDALKAQVTANTTVVQSAMTLIKGLADKIEASKDDPVALQALADELNASNQALAAAIQANTPSSEEPPTPA